MWIRIRDPKSFWPWIQDPGWKNSDPESGINIPDQQHCFLFVMKAVSCSFCRVSLSPFVPEYMNKQLARVEFWRGNMVPLLSLFPNLLCSLHSRLFIWEGAFILLAQKRKNFFRSKIFHGVLRSGVHWVGRSLGKKFENIFVSNRNKFSLRPP